VAPLQVVEEEVPCSTDDEDPEPVASDAPASVMGRDSLGRSGEFSCGGQDHSTTAAAADPGDSTGRSEDAEGSGVADGADNADGQVAAVEVTAAKFSRTKLVRRELLPPPPPTQVVIGRRAQEALLDGEQLSDADTAALVADAIVKLQEGYTASRAATDDNGVPAVDDAGKAAHPQVTPVQIADVGHHIGQPFRRFVIWRDISYPEHCAPWFTLCPQSWLVNAMV